MISGDEGAQQSIPLVEAGNIELQDQVTAQLVVFSRHNPRPADIVQPARDFEQASLTRTVPVETAKPVEKGERESRNLFAVGRIGVVGPRRFDDE